MNGKDSKFLLGGIIVNFNRFDSMKVYRVVLFCLIYVILGVTIYTISYDTTIQQKPYQEVQNVSEENTLHVEEIEIEQLPIEQISEHTYIVKDNNGKVAIYKEGEYDVFIQLEVYTSTLPYVDRQNLLEGFTIVGDDQLRQIIEDFDS